MSLFILIGHDGPRGPELRKLHRPAHLAHWESLAGEQRIRHAGPLLDSAGQPTGSVILFEAESLEAARAQASADPYVAEAIFERHEVHETRAVLPH